MMLNLRSWSDWHLLQRNKPAVIKPRGKCGKKMRQTPSALNPIFIKMPSFKFFRHHQGQEIFLSSLGLFINKGAACLKFIQSALKEAQVWKIEDKNDKNKGTARKNYASVSAD